MSEKLTCKDVSRILSDGLDAEMAPAERARLRLHLVMCDDCRHVDEQLRFLRAAMQRLASGEEPPAP